MFLGDEGRGSLSEQVCLEEELASSSYQLGQFLASSSYQLGHGQVPGLDQPPGETWGCCLGCSAPSPEGEGAC